MMDKCANILIEKKEITKDFVKDLFQRDDVDILYEKIISNPSRTKIIKGILDDTNDITRTNTIETLIRSDSLSLKKFKVGKTNLIKNVVSFKDRYWNGKLVWYEEI